MPRTRTLSLAERWELGLLLVMLCVAFLCLAAIFKRYPLPGLMASKPQAGSEVTSQNVMARLEAAAAPVAGDSVVAGAAPALPAVNTPFSVEIDESPIVVAPDPAPQSKADHKYYGGKRFAYARTVRLRVTAYAPDPRCCWPYDGTTTASGKSVKTNGGKLVAADTRLIPMHSLVVVPGYAGGAAVPVLDRGGAIKGHRLDVLLPTFDQAKKWGSRLVDVKVYEPAN